ncbi:cytochrome p450 [Hirsutella rhossiliensis]|uniref:Cytochrome p450 domain-containing protein n=1 Tax=Hirsutella rhossiliensis TaxID=111463 RepID=A0A9P8MV83_9HYPO|nr:cytochrome p450 domain-containing protein [Hirsutella rhossiliensis]KAH0962728.1 cytochrome p450 domain-containing protein [Hirsutella rhossiliensis]
MLSTWSLIPDPLAWLASFLVFLLKPAAAVLVGQMMASRPRLPRGAPRLLKGTPILGSVDFFRSRSDFLLKGRHRDPSRQFSFYYGPYPIVVVSGSSARSFFYNARSLDFIEGFSALYSAGPSIEHLLPGDLRTLFFTSFKHLMGKDRLAAKLHHLTTDTDVALGAMGIDTSAPVEPFKLMLHLIYQLTHRILGSNDVADDPKLLADTLSAFDRFDDSSAIEVMFPHVPWPSKVRKMLAGAKLHRTFSKIMSDRQRTGRAEADAMQTLIDQGHPDTVVSAFIIGTFVPGLTNSAFNAAWILAYLTANPEWYARIRAEVDAAVAKHRCSQAESAPKVLSRLSMDQWESEFPMINVALRETIRLILQGASMRKNVSGKDIQIADTGKIIPKDAYALYAIEDIHMDDQVYTSPREWDPERYLASREEDKKRPHGYLGWGSGLHPCLGMRFAKLEITISTAFFFAYYDFTRCDKNGNEPQDALPPVDRSGIGEKRPVRDIFLKCTRRNE